MKKRYPQFYWLSFKYIPYTLSSPSIRRVEFHVSRQSRDKYQFEEFFFTSTGNVIFANFYAARLFAEKINAVRDVLHHPEEAASAAEINAMGLIDEIIHAILAYYRQEIAPTVFQEAHQFLQEQFPSQLRHTLLTFLEFFPPSDVYLGKRTPEEYLDEVSEGTPNEQIVLEELILLWLANQNPAFQKYEELFDDSVLQNTTPYPQIITELEEFFNQQPPVALIPYMEPTPLFKFIRKPIDEAPDSIAEQLKYIQQEWGAYLSHLLTIDIERIKELERYGLPGLPSSTDTGTRLLRGLDYIIEEEKLRFHPGAGPAPTEVPDYLPLEEDIEQYSPDLDWMPNLVLIAKSTLVWLDQLSKKYQRSITRLDQIPDEELDLLKNWGFTGLWLIGIWERSKASKRIKQLCGNPEAESSAYSLFDYQIAEDLGGEPGYQNLKERCWKRGIRLACDMVPNHTGIDARWVMEHPEWYIQLPYSPFPSYTFNGPDLSWHPDIGIYLEDHYYDRTDAAVVFKRVDKRTGEERYIYHGNDGTSMPWNDTAQLDYTREEVREAVIRTIIEVAKKAPIIRFDAAMTLTKRHFHRLWFPPPGSGGDIPSRSDYGMTREQFDRLMPKEFWREVVDRVAEEVPDTLLLAEAFWLMEGYFVRTLGMHRVYNSAFMNMLKNEENDKYLATIKKTIEFDPEILKRYVNFMNNPDEETAIHQFGDGDKYFGVCTMLVTMPGLPMFGHGQVEGFREKYGMEYRRAYWDEVPNQYLIERHEKEIFPLMKKRYLFAEVQDFQLYDFYLPDGSIDPNVFAYSNSHQGQHSLVVYHNAYRETRGNIHLSSAKAHRTDNPEEKILIRKTLAEALQLTNAPDRFCVFRDHISGLEFIYPSQKIYSEGLPLTLRAYEYHVFLDFREIQDDGSKRYHQLAETLNGQGVENVETAAKAIFYQPLHEAYSAVMDSQILQEVETFRNTLPLYSLDTVVEIAHQIENRYLLFLSSVKQFEEMDVDHTPLFNTIQNEIKPLLFFDEGWIAKTFHLMKPRFRAGFKFLSSLLKEKNWYPVLWHWVFLHDLGKLIETEEEKSTLLTLSWLEEWQMENCLKRLLKVQGVEDSQVDDTIRLLKLLIRHQYWFDPEVKRKKPYLLLKKLLQSVEFQHFLKIHEFDGILWFNKESFEKALEGLFIIRVFQIVVKAYTQVNEVREQKGPKKAGGSSKESIESDFGKKLVEVYNVIHRWKKAMIESEYQIEKLLNLLK